ncbi:MAG TPA: hypothetical protein VGG28_23500, partial [Kofleriaceae bacterium]
MDGAGGNLEHRRDLGAGMAFEVVQDKHRSSLLVEIGKRSPEQLSLRAEWIFHGRRFDLAWFLAALCSKSRRDSTSDAKQPRAHLGCSIDLVPTPVKHEEHLVRGIGDVSLGHT